MLNNLKTILILFFLFESNTSFSQEFFEQKRLIDLMDMLNWREKIMESSFTYEGSPFWKDEFINGDIYYNSQYIFREVPLRYNIYNEEMQYKYREFTFAFKPNLLVNKIVLRSDTFVVATLNLNSSDSLAFFKVLTEGKVTILSHIHITFQDAKAPGALQDRAVPAKFIRNPDDYYARIGNDPPQKIKSIKKLIAMIDDKRDKLTEYAKREKINSVKPDDLIKLARYYNSL